MTYLVWGALNTALFIIFILICFKATKLIRESMGLSASIVFVLGLVSFIGNSSNDNDNKEPNSNRIKTWKFVSEDSLKNYKSSSIHIDLEKTLFSKFELEIKYGKDSQGQVTIPISAYSSTTGFVSGINWKPTSIIVNKTNDSTTFEYFVVGVVEWKLLGRTLYSQPKDYQGIAVIK